MKAFWVWAHSTKWFLLAVFATVLTIVGFVLRSMFFTPVKPSGSTGVQRLPDVPKPLKEAVAKAEETALIARVEAKVQAEEQTKQLQTILQNPDGVERRKGIATMLKDL
jgi:hypothetical protein